MGESRDTNNVRYFAEYSWSIMKCGAMKIEKELRTANAKQELTGEVTVTSILPVSDTCNEKCKSVIDNLDVAKTEFTPNYLCVNSKMRQETLNESIAWDDDSELKSTFSSEFDNLNDDDRVIWE